MSKHNYSQYSNKKKNDSMTGAVGGRSTDGKNSVRTEVTAESTSATTPSFEPVNVPSGVSRASEVKMVVETVDTVPLPKTVEGVVANCAKLNVRAEPDAYADVVYVLDVMSEIAIDVSKSNNEWFKVCTASGVEGYCMRKFVDARL